MKTTLVHLLITWALMGTFQRRLVSDTETPLHQYEAKTAETIKVAKAPSTATIWDAKGLSLAVIREAEAAHAATIMEVEATHATAVREVDTPTQPWLGR